jgi:hypothetical protein
LFGFRRHYTWAALFGFKSSVQRGLNLGDIAAGKLHDCDLRTVDDGITALTPP